MNDIMIFILNNLKIFYWLGSTFFFFVKTRYLLNINEKRIRAKTDSRPTSLGKYIFLWISQPKVVLFLYRVNLYTFPKTLHDVL